MWYRIKRVITSYLDALTDRVSGPDREVRDVTRGEIARLNELEVQSRATAKLREKELAEVELKLLGAAERVRSARESGDAAAAASAAAQLETLSVERDFLSKQVSEANASADRAHAIREERRLAGEELAAQSHLTTLSENLSAVQSPFGTSDPAATIEEMRAKLKQRAADTTESRVAAADRELAAERARAHTDELLARYKQRDEIATETGTPQPTVSPRFASTEQAPAASPGKTGDESSPGQEKSLGRTDGPVRPLD
ncbi:MAG TPA: hypothetical protein VJH03_15990 [Blastocatellia bacterium]|nr:hypothetical protein [Blastocatellia bacterium]